MNMTPPSSRAHPLARCRRTGATMSVPDSTAEERDTPSRFGVFLHRFVTAASLWRMSDDLGREQSSKIQLIYRPTLVEETDQWPCEQMAPVTVPSSRVALRGVRTFEPSAKELGASEIQLGPPRSLVRFPVTAPPLLLLTSTTPMTTQCAIVPRRVVGITQSFSKILDVFGRLL